MSQFWENLRTDGRTDGRMDWPYFIGPFQLWPGVQKEDIFCTVYFVRGNFFKIRVLPQCIVYLIRLRNINTFTYQKTFLHILLLLVFKNKESLHCILKQFSDISSDICDYWKILQASLQYNNNNDLFETLTKSNECFVRAILTTKFRFNFFQTAVQIFYIAPVINKRSNRKSGLYSRIELGNLGSARKLFKKIKLIEVDLKSLKMVSLINNFMFITSRVENIW